MSVRLTHSSLIRELEERGIVCGEPPETDPWADLDRTDLSALDEDPLGKTWC